MYLAQTPRCRKISLANRRMRSDGSPVTSASAGRIAFYAHSCTPKCGSSAAGRMMPISAPGLSIRCAAVSADQPQPRTVAEGCRASSRHAS